MKIDIWDRSQLWGSVTADVCGTGPLSQYDLSASCSPSFTISRRVPFSPSNGFLSMVALQPGFLETRLLVHSIPQWSVDSIFHRPQTDLGEIRYVSFVPTSLLPYTGDMYDMWFLFLRIRFTFSFYSCVSDYEVRLLGNRSCNLASGISYTFL